MDCGDFVKIGVSGNVEQRATQIPYKVNRIFSTNEIENAFKLEHEMHMMFCEDRVPNALGREYFNISFDIAVSELKKRADEQRNAEPAEPTPRKLLSISEKQKAVLKLIPLLKYVDDFDLGYMLGVAEEKSKSKNMEESEYDFLQDGISSLLSLNEDDLRMTLGYAIALRDKEQRR
jgi:hypothetical protein|nr:MAG TPA: hypothetical protein [Caudoviricetes sp.]